MYPPFLSVVSFVIDKPITKAVYLLSGNWNSTSARLAKRWLSPPVLSPSSRISLALGRSSCLHPYVPLCIHTEKILLDSATPYSANSAARQALVLFFFLIGGCDSCEKVDCYYVRSVMWLALTLLGTMMKVQLTLSPAQIRLLEEAITHSCLYDKLLNKRDPAWIELKYIVLLADFVGDMIRQASYKVIK